MNRVGSGRRGGARGQGRVRGSSQLNTCRTDSIDICQALCTRPYKDGAIAPGVEDTVVMYDTVGITALC